MRIDIKPRAFRSGTFVTASYVEDGRPCGDVHLSRPAWDAYAALVAGMAPNGSAPLHVVIAPLLEEPGTHRPTVTHADRAPAYDKSLAEMLLELPPGQGND